MNRELDLIIEQYLQVLASSVDTASLLIDSLADRATIAIGLAYGKPDTFYRIQAVRMLADMLREKIK